MNRPITFRTQFLMNSITLALVAVLLLASNTFANPGTASTTASTQTTTISYQGHLTDNAGEPVNGDLPMTFALYDAPTGGTAVWTEERSGSNTVPVTAGLFNVLLGSVTPIDVNLFQQQGLWLGISVNGDTEMTPREPLSDVAYAAVAGTVPDGSITQQQAPTLLKSGNNTNVRVYHGSERLTSQGSQQMLQMSVDLSPPCQHHFRVFVQPSFTYHPDVFSTVGGSYDGFKAYFRLDDGKNWGDGQWMPVNWIAICSDD
jgi:hypothetical protein